MLDPATTLLSGSDWKQIVGAYNRIVNELPPDAKTALMAVFKAYYLAYDAQGLYERLNGRTVAQILAEYQEQPSPPVLVKSGERDGVRYTLEEAPRPEGSG
jgi:hypothetical protein